MSISTKIFLAVAAFLAWCAPTTVHSAETAEPEWSDGICVYLAPGYSQIKIPGRSVTMEGIDFNDITADQGNAAYRLSLGYWINEHVGLEISGSLLGDITATFDYFHPPAESGTGETQITLYSDALTLQVGRRFGDFRMAVHGGVVFWRSNYRTKFYLPSGERLERTLEKSGNSLTYGLGASWKIRGNWNLRLDLDVVKIDIVDAQMVTLGIEYRWGNSTPGR